MSESQKNSPLSLLFLGELKLLGYYQKYAMGNPVQLSGTRKYLMEQLQSFYPTLTRLAVSLSDACKWREEAVFEKESPMPSTHQLIDRALIRLSVQLDKGMNYHSAMGLDLWSKSGIMEALINREQKKLKPGEALDSERFRELSMLMKSELIETGSKVWKLIKSSLSDRNHINLLINQLNEPKNQQEQEPKYWLDVDYENAKTSSV